MGSSEFITQMGNVLGSDTFGTDIGTAVGEGSVAIATGATAFVQSFTDELAATDWNQFGSNLQEFVGGLLRGMISQIGPALYNGSIFNPETRQEAIDKTLNSDTPFVEPWIGSIVGSVLEGLNRTSLGTKDEGIVQGYDEMLGGADWNTIGQQIANGFNQTFNKTLGDNSLLQKLAANPGAGWAVATQGPQDIFSQEERQQMAVMGLEFGLAGLGVLRTFGWPAIDLLALGFEWLPIPMPTWWSDLLGWAGIAQESSADASDFRNEAEDILERIRAESRSSNQPIDTGGNTDPGYDPNQINTARVSSVMAVGAGPEIHIHMGDVFINNDLDREQFKLELIAAVRRGMG